MEAIFGDLPKMVSEVTSVKFWGFLRDLLYIYREREWNRGR